MRSLLLIVFLTFCHVYVSAQTQGLTLLSIDTIIDRQERDAFSYFYAKFVNSKGEKLNQYERTELNSGKMARDYYADAEGQIVKVVVRPYELEDKFNEIRIRTASYYIQNHTEYEMSCDTISKVLDKIINDDSSFDFQPFQNSTVFRDSSTFTITNTFTNDTTIFNWEQIDSLSEIHVSQEELFVLAIEQCGWPVQENKKIETALLTLNTNITAKYYTQLLEYVDQGQFDSRVMAQLKDRLLLRNDFNQIYGTQLRNGRLTKLDEPGRVNRRRMEMGLEPIEVFCDKNGLDFDIEVERMRRGL